MKHAPHPLRTLLVGAGRIARRHITALAQLPEHFSLVGLVDPRFGDGELEQNQGDVWLASLPRYTSFDADLLAHHAPDLVVLCSPSGIHHAQAHLALSSGAHVLCEKPVALSSAALHDLLSLASRSRRLLIPAHQTRTYPCFTHLRRWLHHDHLLGQLHTVNLSLQLSRPQSYFDEVPWRGSRSQDGGVLWNQAIHLVDWVVDLVGHAPEQIFSLQPTLRRQIEAPDHASLLFTFPGGVANISASLLAAPANFSASIELLGDLGAIRLGGAGACHIEEVMLSPDAPRAISRAEIDAINLETDLAITQAHQRLYRLAMAQLRGEPRELEQLDATLSVAARVTRLLELAASSAAQQKLLPWSEPPLP